MIGKKWKEAAEEEINSLNDKNTWILVDNKNDNKLIGCKWVFNIKRNGEGNHERYKARLVAKGYTQLENIDYHETFSPVSKMTSIRLILKLAMINQMFIKQLDVKTAFLNGTNTADLYMKQPEGFDDGSGRVCKLVKSLYGLKQASHVWNKEIDKIFKEMEFKQSKSDQCIYFLNNQKMKCFIILYVDDLVIAATDKDYIDDFVKNLETKFEIKILPKFDYFLGININHEIDKNIIHLNQRKYIENLLHKFGLSDCRSVITPIDPNTKLIKNEKQIDEDLVNNYQKIIGSFHYLVNCTRPDIAVVTCILSQYNQNPGTEHLLASKRVLRYLKGTIDLGIKIDKFKSGEYLNLICYVDADWGGNFIDKRSTTGYIFYLNDNLISWSTKKQQTVALSSTEAEYMAETEATKEAIWLKNLLNELGFQIKLPIKIICDNQVRFDWIRIRFFMLELSTFYIRR